MLTEAEIQAKADDLRNLLREALDAIQNPQVLADLVTFAQTHPTLAWEPAALAGFALASRRQLKQTQAAAPGSLPKTLLPSAPSTSSNGAGPGIALPPPPKQFF